MWILSIFFWHYVHTRHIFIHAHLLIWKSPNCPSQRPACSICPGLYSLNEADVVDFVLQEKGRFLKAKVFCAPPSSKLVFCWSRRLWLFFFPWLSLIPWKRVKLQQLTCEERAPLLAYCNMMHKGPISPHLYTFSKLRAGRSWTIDKRLDPFLCSLISPKCICKTWNTPSHLWSLDLLPTLFPLGLLPYVFQCCLCVISVIFTWCRGPLVWLMPSCVLW